MADRPTTTPVGTGAQYKAATLNANFTTVEDGIENGLGRGGTGESNNSMQGTLDMDNNTIQNVKDPVADLDAANRQFVEANLGANSLLNSAAAVSAALAAAGYATDALTAQTAAETAQTAAEAAAASIALGIASVDIGLWDMDAVDFINVAHGLDVTKIHSVTGTVVSDSGVKHTLSSDPDNNPGAMLAQAAITSIDGTNVRLTRKSSGFFTGTDWNDAIDRGQLVILYEV